MIWGKTHTEQDRENRTWKLWFAWFPVELFDGQFAWFEKVYRLPKRKTGFYYRLSSDTYFDFNSLVEKDGKNYVEKYE